MTVGRFDAVVVGAGPAGSIAALVLARGGASVALVDKAAFPRDKACGDLVGPRGVRVLADLGVDVPYSYRGTTLLATGPSGGRARLPVFPGRTYADHGICVPRRVLDDVLWRAAVDAGATPIRARIGAVDRRQDGGVDAVVAGNGRRLRGDAIIGADGALSPVARLTGMLSPDMAVWGFAIRGYVPAQVPEPILAFLDSRPWRVFPGCGWLFPGEEGRANVGIGVALGRRRRPFPLHADLAAFCARLRASGDLEPDARLGPVTGGWMRMAGTGTPIVAGNVLLVGDAAGLVNPLQGEGIAPAMVSGRLAGEAVLANPDRPGRGYAVALDEEFGRYMPGAAALQTSLLQRPRLASAGFRLLTAPLIRKLAAGTFSLYLNGLVDGAQPRFAAWNAGVLQGITARLAHRAALGTTADS